jgi:PPK2 family polyphosphate:nucleotide phosphotransferase
MLKRADVKRFCVRPGHKVHLKDYPTDFRDVKGVKLVEKLDAHELKARATKGLAADLAKLSSAQELLYASDTWSVLLIFQAMDAAGKDGTIRHVMSGVNPQGCQVFSFKQPSAEELDHNFLWRSMKALPERGRIGIFNRSYYEDVLVVRVHPEWLERAKLPPGKRGAEFWNARYDDINRFERHLVRNGTLILKFFLHVSKDEQKQRFLDRLENPDKHWKFSAADLAERAHWDEYAQAYEDALNATSTRWAPWYVIPADRKWATRAIVADILVSSIESLKLEYPQVSKDDQAKLADARRQLENE